MLREGRSDDARFAENETVCGQTEVAGQRWFCSRSCEDLGHHFLIVPDPSETYDEAVARARAEGL